MARNLDTLLAQAAELRAAGHTWESVGHLLRRDPRTCQNWPSRFRDRWEPLYLDARQRRLDQTGAEANDHFLTLLRADDPRWRLRALGLWMRCGAGVYGGPVPDTPPPAADPGPGPYARMLADARADMAAARERLDRRRAGAGLPPAADDEFLDEYGRELETLRWFRELSSTGSAVGAAPATGPTPLVRPAGPARQAGPATDPNVRWALALAAAVVLAFALEPAAPPPGPDQAAARTWLVRAAAGEVPPPDPTFVGVPASAGAWAEWPPEGGTPATAPARAAVSRRPLPAPPRAGYPDRVPPPSPNSPAGDRMADPTTAYLVAERDDGFGDVYPLTRGVTYGVGRSPKNRVVLADDLCSRDHAELAFAEGAWYVRDLGSLNGTRVNGKSIRADLALSGGDRVQFGRTRFRFVHDLAELPGIPDPASQAIEDSIRITRRTSKTRFLPPPPAEGDDDPTVSEPAPDRAVATLYRLALDMGAAKTVEDLAEAVLAGLFAGVPAEHGAVMAVKAGRELELLAHRNRDGRVRTYHKASQLVSSEVLDTREAVLADNVLSDPQYATRDSLRELKAESLICVPVQEGDRVIGLIHLYTSSPQKFTDDDLEYALAVARQTAAVWSQLQRQDALTNTNRELKSLLALESELVGSSSALKHIEGQIQRVAGTSATVLIRGESGSGKELVARAIHNTSPRRDGPFVTLNCAAITESLLESELFGHEKGAFTGATEKMIGKFEAADRGTIFLDEIGEMPLSTQSKFLRVLEGHPFERLGGNNLIKVDVRVVAATNRPLEQAVREGHFRRDLFYRLQVVEIRVPPLRDRLDDVPVLAEHFLKKFTRETGRRIKGFTPDALEKLQTYAWPGNVRELRNVIERAVALNDKPHLDSADLWLTTLDQSGSGQHPVLYRPQSLEEIEKRHIKETLRYTDWNKSKAAEILGIERSTLDRKIKAYGLVRE